MADDDQIIYQWNGASPERLNQLKDEFSMTVIQLPECYRCPPEVIDIANKLIVHNLGRDADKKLLRAHKVIKDSNCIKVKKFGSLEKEAIWIARDIASRSSESIKRCVVLARTRRVLEVILKALNEAGVNAYLSLRKDEFITAPLSWLHSILRLANSRQDREQLRKVCKAFYSIGGISINVRDVVSTASTEKGDYLRAWRKTVLNRSGLDSETRFFIKDALKGLSDKLDYKKFVIQTFSWYEALGHVNNNYGTYDEDYIEEKRVWDELTNEINAQYGKENVTLNLHLQELDLRSKAPTPPPDAVPCFTIHASKGMEFGHVYLASLVEDQLPSWAAVKKGDDSLEMQEERRNCFVAITRTQESLTLTYSQMVFGWNRHPSRFLKEMGLT